ncbi:DUF4274 domain-containing protein [Taibaiella koreensis]|uniref:DUF4274 domain-containing protein n=1 Tax=Taibaiella koreensis TaxID=1268548 RepID=UPI000E59A0E7|nr:DUF4274 domain-containing protein [Taibaiella koreensis]
MMNAIIERIIYQEEALPIRLELVRSLDDPQLLWALMSHYNWDDGFAIPLETVRHAQCDLGLALMLFWEFDEARIFYDNPESLKREFYNETDNDYRTAFCQTLIDGIRNGHYQPGSNKYDTGFYGEDLDLENASRQRIRAIKTKKARERYEEAFLKPLL